MGPGGHRPSLPGSDPKYLLLCRLSQRPRQPRTGGTARVLPQRVQLGRRGKDEVTGVQSGNGEERTCFYCREVTIGAEVGLNRRCHDSLTVEILCVAGVKL